VPVIDASSVVHAWDNYPIENFPKFWAWLLQEFTAGSLLISSVAYVEIRHVSPDCHDWLKKNSVGKVNITSVMVRHAKLMKTELGISNDKYSPKGVDENDILIIATAKAKGTSLISNESKQPSLPADKKQYKIPAVCALQSVSVSCLDIAEFIKQSKQVF
jgi:hypothetical protein